jgi:transcriptional regulator with XRE-family HTH domain
LRLEGGLGDGVGDHRPDEAAASRRARLSPEQVGLISYGARRVPGLRRAEVAQLAGVSIEYYTRLERGNLSGVSEAVLDSLVAALQLDESERAYLFDLAKAASAPSTPRRPRKATGQEVRPNWSDSADTSVSILRTETGRNPYDRGLTDLVGELSTRSEEFRTRWAA